MSRFADRYRVVFVEEPMPAAEESPSMLGKREVDGVTVLTPLLSRRQFGHGYGEQVNPHIRKLLSDWLTRHDPGNRTAVWYWTPLALGACPEALSTALVVFDAMDELSAFKFASEDLIQKEAALMRWADLIFTGGPSLYQARSERHPRVSCFPSGVDVAHYRVAAVGRRTPEAAALHLGYVGVLDERIDFALIAGIADLRPEWTITLVGPLAKIGPEDIPSRPNIQLRGMQPYEALPNFMTTFDVGMLPFALNEATRFISPTKTLEYLAAELPVVSTPVHDVSELYGDCVAIAPDAEAFVAAAEAMVSASASTMRIRKHRAAAHLEQHSWDTIVASMGELMERATRPAYAPQRSTPIELLQPTAGQAD
jgi:glycosyltransferase involved in cell wall biosynthesis